MKTKELIERLSALGYSTSKHWDTFDVLEMITPEHGRIHGRIHRKEPYRIETTQYTRQDPRVFDLMVEYARTPLDEREEPKKYYWRLGGVGEYVLDNMYFARSPFNEEWHLTNKRDEATPYTEAEFEELYIRFDIDLEFLKEVYE